MGQSEWWCLIKVICNVREAETTTEIISPIRFVTVKSFS